MFLLAQKRPVPYCCIPLGTPSSLSARTPTCPRQYSHAAGHPGNPFSACDTPPFPASKPLSRLHKWVRRPYIFRGVLFSWVRSWLTSWCGCWLGVRLELWSIIEAPRVPAPPTAYGSPNAEGGLRSQLWTESLRLPASNPESLTHWPSELRQVAEALSPRLFCKRRVTTVPVRGEVILDTLKRHMEVLVVIITVIICYFLFLSYSPIQG